MHKRPSPWHLEDPAAEAAARQRRAAIWRRHDRAIRLRREIRRVARPGAVLLVLAFLAGAVLARMESVQRDGVTGWVRASALGRIAGSPWPADLALRHEIARQNCAAARAVGLAPAWRGEPGYWPHLDADQDGIACEPWPPPGDRRAWEPDGSWRTR